jgi:hypothetical protein
MSDNEMMKAPAMFNFCQLDQAQRDHRCRQNAACRALTGLHLTVQTPTTMIPLQPRSLSDRAKSVF